MRYIATLLIALLLSLVALGDEVPLTASELVPAGQGKVSFEHDKNKNTRFKLETKHLARPNSLSPAKSNYVVWVKPRGKDPQNMGILTLNDNLEGSLTGTTPYQDFDVIVTAEDSPSIDHPTGPEVLHGTVQQH